MSYQNQQQIQQQQQQQNQHEILSLLEFKAGVISCLRSWSAFRTAIEHGWGLVTKGDDVCTTIVQWGTITYQYNITNNITIHANANENANIANSSINNIKYCKPFIDKIDLEDYLIIYMEEEFSLQLEDESERQVSETIFTLYEQCCYYNNYTLARSLTNTIITATANNNTATVAAAISNNHNVMCIDNDSDIEEDDDDDDNDNNNNHDMEMEDDTNVNTHIPTTPKLVNFSIPAIAATTAATASATATVVVSSDDNNSDVDINSRIAYLQEYIQQPLFGYSESNQQRQSKPKVLLQLGEALQQQQQQKQYEEQQQQSMIDEDGFAPVVTSKNKKKK